MMKKKTSTFTIKSGSTIMASSDTTDVYSRSQSACASMCLLHDKCCVVSFSEESLICRLNTADNCCAATDNATGSSVMTRNQYTLGYWIGGYNFHNDDDMEWVGEPNQVMPFSDMAANQPSNPMTELCMMMWKSWDFQWADHSCGSLLSYVCEFMHH
ncbi:unnamed protein product [Mytilus edulis]|uniref:C-type lectin domain-containing protein n=1 Tax=Mytilus edulis TaxID=6550 RepID=A0A8S3SXH7_MYTED|nr:unnamed protein product [Mytilus edulis]